MSGAPLFFAALLGLALPALADGPIHFSEKSDSGAKPTGPLLNPGDIPVPNLLKVPDDDGPKLEITPTGKPAYLVLRKFLTAPTWQARLPTILHADSLKKVIQSYYAVTSDGPIAANNIQQLPESSNGAKEIAFQVAGPGLEHPVPLRVVSTESGYKVDWLMFTEFKDDLLLKFATSYHENSARFHVLMRRSHYFEKDVPNLEGKNCFHLEPPVEGYSINCFVEKGSDLAKELDSKAKWGMPSLFVVAELRWRKKAGFEWLELAAVPQYDWKDSIPNTPATEKASGDAPKKTKRSH